MEGVVVGGGGEGVEINAKPRRRSSGIPIQESSNYGTEESIL